MHVQLVTWRGHLKQGQQGAATLVGRVQGLPTPPHPAPTRNHSSRFLLGKLTKARVAVTLSSFCSGLSL